MIKINYNSWAEVFNLFEEYKRCYHSRIDGPPVFAVWLEQTFKPEPIKDNKMTLKEFWAIINNPNPLDACDVHLKALWELKDYDRIFQITGLRFYTYNALTDTPIIPKDFDPGGEVIHRGKRYEMFDGWAKNHLRLNEIRESFDITAAKLLGLTLEEHRHRLAEAIKRSEEENEKREKELWYQELMKCQDDPTYFFEKYWRVFGTKPINDKE